MLKSVPGTNDYLPSHKEAAFREPVVRHVTETARKILESAGAKMVYTPIFEYAEVFQKGAGLTSDIVVKKEMYTFLDRGERLLALRPEPTASVVRAYNQNGMRNEAQPVRLFTWGPIFRAERHQKGRYKQFHQVDYEVLGSADPLVDAETIALMVMIYKSLGLSQISVKLGSVGDPNDRVSYNAYLRELFSPYADELSEDSRVRLESNPMRILDSKSVGDQEIISKLSVKPMLDFLGAEARTFHEAVMGYLSAMGIIFEVDPNIVRGLDYYVRTAWEVHHEGVGAKSALSGGGRYDGLSEMLGGPPLPGVGFGIGIERVGIALEAEGIDFPSSWKMDLFIVPLDEAAKGEALVLANQLRPEANVEVGNLAKKIGKGFEQAERKGGIYILFLGETERSSDVLKIKNLQTGTEHSLARGELLSFLVSNR